MVGIMIMWKALAGQGIYGKSWYFQLCCESKTKIFFFFNTLSLLLKMYLFLTELGLC